MTNLEFLEETAFANDSAGLVPEVSGYFPDSDAGSASISANGVATGTETFPTGLTIYGRWSSFKLASGGVIAYIG